MSTAAAGALPIGKGAGVSILGAKVSWDALLVAGAGLAGVIFLFKLGQPSGTFTPSSTVDPSGGGADSSSISTVPALPPTQAFSSYAGANAYAGGASQVAVPAGGPSSYSSSGKPAPTTTSAPLGNYSAGYAAIAGPRQVVSGSNLQVAGALSGIPILNNLIGRDAATPVPTAAFNPVVPRSSGTQAL